MSEFNALADFIIGEDPPTGNASLRKGVVTARVNPGVAQVKVGGANTSVNVTFPGGAPKVGAACWITQQGPVLVGQSCGDRGWTTPVLSNGWTHYQGDATNSADEYGPWQYRRTADGLVHCRGLLTGTNRTSDLPIVMPPGYRPARHYIFVGWSSAGQFEWRIHNFGNLNVFSAAAWISVTGVWQAEL